MVINIPLLPLRSVVGRCGGDNGDALTISCKFESTLQVTTMPMVYNVGIHLVMRSIE